MNILPKKSWHVRNKQNIERVRRDEAKAAEEEKEKQRRIALAESESRTELLRVRARKRQREDDKDDDDGSRKKQLVEVPSEHINFFRDEEEGKQSGGTNAEYEAEKKAEKEKQEKAVGLLTYLGQSSLEAQSSRPWYEKPAEKKRKLSETEKPQTSSVLKEEFDLKHKWSQDPMKRMGLYLRQKEKIEIRDKETMKDSRTKTPLAITSTAHSHSEASGSKGKEPSYKEICEEMRRKLNEKPHKKKKKKDKEKHKEKHKSKKHKSKKHHKKHKLKDAIVSKTASILNAVSSANSTPSSGKSIQQLRAERLRREREEKAKSEQLLARLRGDEPAKTEAKEPTDERDRGYNSQFNPDFVRKRKKKDYSYDNY